MGKDFDKFLKLLKASKKMSEGIFIHCHPREMPLSIGDIRNMFTGNINDLLLNHYPKKVIATTPSGGFSYMAREKKVPLIMKYQISQDLDQISRDIEKWKKSYPDLLEQEKIKSYHAMLIPKLQAFADKFGFEFKYQLTI